MVLLPSCKPTDFVVRRPPVNLQFTNCMSLDATPDSHHTSLSARRLPSQPMFSITKEFVPVDFHIVPPAAPFHFTNDPLNPLPIDSPSSRIVPDVSTQS